MIIPTITLRKGHAVQLGSGDEPPLNAGDPRPIAGRFGIAGEVAVTDLDAALGEGSNAELITELLRIAPCRVGGGIRSVADAERWLDLGAQKVVLGTAARPEILKELPRKRVIAALDAVHGEVVVDGWREPTGRTIIERMEELGPWVSGFLVTFIEDEGQLRSADLERIHELVARAGSARVTIAGGISSAADVRALDRMGADCQVGLALYTGALELAEAIAAPLVSDRADGLWPTIVCDEQGASLGLVYSNLDSITEAVAQKRGIYYSRRHRKLWTKGQTSGARQELIRIEPDCDRDALRFIVRQHWPGFCQRETWTCFGPARGLARLMQTIDERAASAPEGSSTRALLDDPSLLHKRLKEEVAELAKAEGYAAVTEEVCDLIFLGLVAAARAGVRLADIEAELDRRSLKVTGRGGDAEAEER